VNRLSKLNIYITQLTVGLQIAIITCNIFRITFYKYVILTAFLPLITYLISVTVGHIYNNQLFILNNH